MYNLKDTYESVGRTMESLLDEIRDMEGKTTYITVEPKDICFASIKSREGNQMVFYWITKDTIKNSPDKCPPLKKISVDHVNKELLEESINSTGLIICVPIDGLLTALYASPLGISALAEKAGVGGISANTPSIFRDMHIAESLYSLEKPLKLVIRTNEEEGREDMKLFGAVSERYKNISLEIIPETVNSFEKDGSMGMSELRKWINRQPYTEAIVEFPDAADELQMTYGLLDRMIPGVRVSTSDVGEASVRVQGTFRIDGRSCYSVRNEVKRNHSGKVEVKDIIEEVKKSIFAEIKELPQKLASLMDKTLGDFDLTTDEGRKKNRDILDKAVRRGIRKLHISKTLGQKRAKELEEQLRNEFSCYTQYTEYDLAVAFLGLGDRTVGLSDNLKKQLEKAVADAPFITYQNRDDSEEIGLLPEEV